MEPPFLLRHRVALSKWRPVLDALEDVMLQTSAMESALEGQGQHACMLLSQRPALTLHAECFSHFLHSSPCTHSPLLVPI